MTPESKFRKKVRPLLLALPNSWWTSISQRSIVGTPDVIGCIGPWIIVIEFKAREGAYRSKMQEKNLYDVSSAGGYAKFVYPENWFTIYAELREIAAHPWAAFPLHRP